VVFRASDNQVAYLGFICVGASGKDVEWSSSGGSCRGDDDDVLGLPLGLEYVDDVLGLLTDTAPAAPCATPVECVVLLVVWLVVVGCLGFMHALAFLCSLRIWIIFCCSRRRSVDAHLR
jgi:hypothetical protein